MVNDFAGLHDLLTDVIVELENRVSDFPGPTCSDIDSVIRTVEPIRKEADKLAREDGPLAEFASEVDSVLWGLPSDLDDLRNYNDQLRTSLHEALQSRKDALALLKRVADLLPTEGDLP